MTVLNCKGVLFDCDGVLVDSEASVTSAWERWAHNLHLDPEEVRRLVVGRRSADTVALVVPEGRQAEALACIDRYEVEDAMSVSPVAGALTLVASIPGDSWAVVTSGRKELARARLRAAGLPFPGVLIAADDVAVGKPHPEGYKTAAKRLGLRTLDTVVVEDAPIGVRAARAAGAGAVVGVGRRVASAGADVVVEDLTSLLWTSQGLEVVGVAPQTTTVSRRQ